MSGIGTGYDLSTTTYSPDGKVFQVDYAGKAVDNGGLALGIKCSDGVVLGVEKLVPYKMLVPGSNRRIAVGLVHTVPLFPWKMRSVTRSIPELTGGGAGSAPWRAAPPLVIAPCRSDLSFYLPRRRFVELPLMNWFTAHAVPLHLDVRRGVPGTFGTIAAKKCRSAT